jgi:hypothetical protein
MAELVPFAPGFPPVAVRYTSSVVGEHVKSPASVKLPVEVVNTLV